MFWDREDGTEKRGFNWRSVCDRAGRYGAPALLVMVLEHQGWHLWYQGRAVFMWLLAVSIPIWRGSRLASVGGDALAFVLPRGLRFRIAEAVRLPTSTCRARIGSLWQRSSSWELPGSRSHRWRR